MKIKLYSLKPEFVLSGLFVVLFNWYLGAQCNNDVGTINGISSFIGQSTRHDIRDTVFLCWEDRFYLDHNDDFNVSSDPDPTTPAGIGYAWYKSRPMVSGDNLTAIKTDDVFRFAGDPNIMITVDELNGDAMFENRFYTGFTSFNEAINGGGIPTLMYYAPITFDQRKGHRGYHENGGACVKAGVSEAFPVVYLNPIEISDFLYNENGDPLQASFIVKGGLPEYYKLHDGKNFNYKGIDIVDPDNSNVKGEVLTQSFGQDDRVYVKVPRPGQYQVIISDGVSCTNINYLNISAGINPTLVLDSVSAKQNEIKCVTLSVKDFKNVEIIFGRIDYDPSVLEFVSLNPIYPDQYNSNVEYPGLLRVDWAPNTDSLPDGKELFMLCFRLIGEPGECSPVIMNKFQGADVDIHDIYPYLEQGMICIDPPDGLYISANYCGSESNVAESIINFKVFNGVPPYTYVVMDNVGNTVESGSIADENIETNVVGLFPGSYTIEVTDSNAEKKSYSLFVAAIPPLEFESVDVSNPNCYGSNDGSIKVKVKDADFNPYDIKWSNGVFNVDTVKNLGNGTYGITIVDKTSGCKTDTFVNLFTTKLELNVTKLDDASCEGIDDGRILANVTGGTPSSLTGYRFKWQTSNNFFTENTPATSILNNATTGWVYITVNDSVPWCKVSDSVFIDKKYTMELSSSKIDPTCYGDKNGLIQYNANLLGHSGNDFDLEFPVFPHPPFSDVQKLGSDQFFINNLGVGRYITKIFEKATGCFKIDTIQLYDPPPISINLETNKAGCEGQLAYANFKNISGGTIPYTITGIGDDTLVLNQSSYVFHDLEIGTYTVHIEDANGCDTTVIFDIVRADGLLNIDTIMFDLLGCDATATTNITVQASSTHGTIHYSWTDELGISLGSDNPTLSNVGAGTYIVSLVDDMCTLSDTIIVPEPNPFTFTTQTSASECGPGESGGFGGSACINIDGDDSGFSYQWSNGLSGKCITEVPAGSYFVTISDAGGCTSIDTIEVPGAPPIQINVLDVQGISCNDGQHTDGSAILQASGGNNPAGLFVFTLDNGSSKVGNIITLNNLSGGVNHFTVYYNTVNGNSCSKSDSFEIGVPERLSIDLIDTKIFKPTCNGDCDGTIIVKAKGGNNAAYFYKWQENGQSGAIATDMCAGTYHVEITDANLCSVVDSVTLTEPENLVVEIDSANTKDVNCSGPNSGQIAVNFTGGNNDGPYSFNWNPNVSDSRLAKNLSQGVYVVTVSDYKGCSDFVSYEVKGQQPIVFNVIQRDTIQCYGDKTCLTIDTVSGGAGPDYTFSVNGGPIVPVDSCRELYASEQPYLISVFDSEGCKSEQEYLITQPEQIIVDLGDEIQLDLGDPKTIHLNTNSNISEVIWNIDSINFKYEFLNDLKTELKLEGYANDSIYATVIDENGCTATGALYVVVNTSRNVYIPNIFSPDGDGLNDEFRLTIGKGITSVNYMKIYDRWGELMFQENNINPAAANSIGWDGTYKGKRVNPGVYVYLVEVEFLDGRKILYRGAVTLIR